MSTIPPEHRNVALLGLAAVLAAQIPATIASIPDPLVRAILQTSILILVIALAWLANPPKGPPSIKLINAPQIDPLEPDTLRDAPQAKNRLQSIGMA